MIALSGRFWAKVTITDGCWLWTGCTNSKGYGVVSIDGRRELAHRVSYQEHVGPIPDGFTIDHVRERGCTSKVCVNPAHLEPVTRRENSQRQARALTRCRRGHQLTLREGDRQRRCRTCEADRKRERGLVLAT